MNLDQIFRGLSFFIIGVCFTIVFMSLMHQSDWMASKCDVTTAIESDVNNIHQGHNSTLVPVHCASVPFIPPFSSLNGLAALLKSEHKRTGVSLRSGNGELINATLPVWQTADEFVVVDKWIKNNTVDTVALDATRRVGNFLTSNQYVKKYIICQNESLICANNYPDEHFDFLLLTYKEEDYKTVMTDLTTWWPKVKVGGLVGGLGGLPPLNPNSQSSALADFFSDAKGHLKGCARQLVWGYAGSGWAARK